MDGCSSIDRVGVLLVNLGTPDSPSSSNVRRYLREFLSDARVLDIPALPRRLLLETVILPFRPKVAAAAYAKIWTEEGSPLLVHGRALQRGVAERLGEGFQVELAMRYGHPSIPEAVALLRESAVSHLVVLPLFPQYSAAATASALSRVYEAVGSSSWDVESLSCVPDFYAHRGFIDAFAAGAREPLSRFAADHVLFSFHGLPERQVQRSDPSGAVCLASDECCGQIGRSNFRCYRAQCFATTRALVAALELDTEDAPAHSVSFQSRLGRIPWIRPYTDEVLPALAANGVKRLAVFCPAFVADCLETLEEIGIRARDQWSELGGDELLLLPCPNANPVWVDATAEMVRDAVPRGVHSPRV